MSLFLAGGTYMVPLLLIAIGASVIAILSAIQITKGTHTAHRINLVLHLGVLSLVVGVLGQTVGLYAALMVIEQVGDISPALLAGGLKVSFIAPIFGLIILTCSLIVWMALRTFAASKVTPS